MSPERATEPGLREFDLRPLRGRRRLCSLTNSRMYTRTAVRESARPSLRREGLAPATRRPREPIARQPATWHRTIRVLPLASAETSLRRERDSLDGPRSDRSPPQTTVLVRIDCTKPVQIYIGRRPSLRGPRRDRDNPALLTSYDIPAVRTPVPTEMVRSRLG